jgi:transcriptional regulator with XRE-family HTH domain
MIDEEVRRLARLLEALVKVERVPVRELERRLDLGGGTLNRIFSGKIELKVRHILLVLDALGVKPLAFFEQALKVPEGQEEQVGARLLESVETLRRRPWLKFQAEAEPTALTEEDVRRVVIEVMREVGFGPRKSAPGRPSSKRTPPKEKKSPQRPTQKGR